MNTPAKKPRSKRGWWLVGALALLVGGVLYVRSARGPSPVVAAGISATDANVTVYRSATCGCCGNFVSYLKQKGFEVTTKIVKDIGEVQDAFGIPAGLRSCHTSIINGKVIEGHMPMEAMEKFLKEKPDVKGIALPGMPSGSPGMPGAKRGFFEIYSFTDSTASSPYMNL